MFDLALELSNLVKRTIPEVDSCLVPYIACDSTISCTFSTKPRVDSYYPWLLVDDAGWATATQLHMLTPRYDELVLGIRLIQAKLESLTTKEVLEFDKLNDKWLKPKAEGVYVVKVRLDPGVL